MYISEKFVKEHITQEYSKVKTYRENNKHMYMFVPTMKSKKYTEINGLSVEEDYIGENINSKKRRIMMHPSKSYAESQLKNQPGQILIAKVDTDMLEHITSDLYLYSNDIPPSDIIGPNSKRYLGIQMEVNYLKK